MSNVLSFKTRAPSAMEVALKITGMGNGPGASLGAFKALDADMDLVGTNERFALNTCPQIRIATLMCMHDEAGLHEFVEVVARAGALGDLLRSLDETSEFLGLCISTMALAHERLEKTATLMGIDIEKDGEE
jgi:hypothetical protein